MSRPRLQKRQQEHPAGPRGEGHSAGSKASTAPTTSVSKRTFSANQSKVSVNTGTT